LGAALIRRTVVVVTTEELSATGGVLVGVVGVVVRTFAGRWRWGSDVVVDGGVDEVVVTGDVKEGGRDEAAGPLGVAADVRVNTKTTRRIGLDHIKRCVLFREKGARAIVFEG
jgi:hypothetical protein